jgi:hypothetical protein
MAVLCSTPFNFSEIETIKKNNDTVGIVGIKDSTPTVIYWKKPLKELKLPDKEYKLYELYQITQGNSSISNADKKAALTKPREIDASGISADDIDDIANKLKELMHKDPKYNGDTDLISGTINSLKGNPQNLQDAYNSMIPAVSDSDENVDIVNLCNDPNELEGIFTTQHANFIATQHFVEGTDTRPGLFNAVKKDINDSIGQHNLEESGFEGHKFKRLPITGNGDCLYDTFTVGIVNNTTEEEFTAKATTLTWNPKKYLHHEHKEAGYPNYNGNLRSVLYNYICSNKDDNDFPIQDVVHPDGNILFSKNTRVVDVMNRLKRVNPDKRGTVHGGWAENEEIQLLAKLFNVNIMTYNDAGNIHTMTTNLGTQTVVNNSDNNDIDFKTTIYMMNIGGYHFELLIPEPVSSGGRRKSSTKKRGGRRKSSTKKRGGRRRSSTRKRR